MSASISMELVVSIAAIILSLISFGWQIIVYIDKLRNNAIIASVPKMIDIEKRIGDEPNLLKFHGFEDPISELNKHGLTPQEFSYLVTSFTAGGVYYRTSSHPEELLKENSYRRNMCKSEPMRRAWPLVRRLLTDSNYSRALDEIFEQLDRDSPLSKE